MCTDQGQAVCLRIYSQSYVRHVPNVAGDGNLAQGKLHLTFC